MKYRRLRRAVEGRTWPVRKWLVRRILKANRDVYLFDGTFWGWLDRPSPHELALADVVPTWNVALKADAVSLPSALDISRLEEACYSEVGVWPLSYSHPRAEQTFERTKTKYISDIKPTYVSDPNRGPNHPFIREDEYLRDYGDSYLAFTHRKGGWDCLRHIEILEQDCIPLMPDAHAVPRHNMVHYPLQGLSQVADAVRASGAVPDDTLRTRFREFTREHMSTQARARYILSRSSLIDCDRVAFFDTELPSWPDYASVMTLIGLKQVLGRSCVPVFPVPYIYEDCRQDLRLLYGRGFGYSRVVSPQLRADYEWRPWRIKRTLRSLTKSFDAVVVGNVAQNGRHVEGLIKAFGASRVVLVHGEDHAPSMREVHALRASGAHAFVRAI